MHRRRALFATPILLSGCAFIPAPAEKEPTLQSDSGALLFSQTMNPGRHTHDSWFYFRKKGSTKTIRTDAAGTVTFKKPNDFPELTDRIGRVQLLPLDPGEYELMGWTLYIQTFGGYGYISPRKSLPPIAFAVEPGQVTYIGRLHVETLMGKNVFGLSIPAGGHPECVDRLDSDTEIFRSKFPSWRTVAIKSSVLDLGVWADQRDA